MNFESELEKMVEGDLEAWKEQKHQAVFNIEEGDDQGRLCGALWIDGKPFRPGHMVANHWIDLNEAKEVAAHIGAELKIA